ADSAKTGVAGKFLGKARPVPALNIQNVEIGHWVGRCRNRRQAAIFDPAEIQLSAAGRQTRAQRLTQRTRQSATTGRADSGRLPGATVEFRGEYVRPCCCLVAPGGE